MACEYCNGSRQLSERSSKLSQKGDFYPGIDAGVYGAELSISAVGDTYEPSYQEVYIPIKYCPMCGQKLSEEART